jgi:hypothetical protein
MIDKPKTSSVYPDRDLDCQQAIEPEFLQIISAATASGWSQAEIAQALIALAEANRAKLADEEPQ